MASKSPMYFYISFYIHLYVYVFSEIKTNKLELELELSTILLNIPEHTLLCVPVISIIRNPFGHLQAYAPGVF